MASAHSLVTDADLHGLVDGHLEPDRRVEALRRLAASPADRARVEAWQRQTDLLRSAFAGVEYEPVPAALDLKTRPQLHCVPAAEGPVAAPERAATRRWPRFGTAFATLVVIAAGLGGSWVFLDSDNPDDSVADTKAQNSAVADLASRTSEAAIALSQAAASSAAAATALPTTRIPNLQPAGFAFVGAEVGAAGPSTIVFRYRRGASDRLVVSVARTKDAIAEAEPARIGNAYGWQTHGTAYAVAGTVGPKRLHAIAVALENDDAAADRGAASARGGP